ncbi:helix-turn-helix domain-containing protein [Hyunsoonleella pacifica]|uniref:Helix-turn-helix domain-containing protein n=1 Tax=Hyunsoonleella pacifica TaxID=1080224 RepID=A0A4Q9FIW7_9FLAO|nr:helix-turn-helix domain-containing protein [Hyunsoonleella pacifica]TBN12483.1 helix-turn-helix domain-containing protein [Hyunsoonleella pacifica]GGD29121.1 hypothetical protein GCM10011368_33870 [Hyunsoonleella pacifica]
MKFEDKLRQLIKTKYSKLGDLADKFEMNYSQLSQYVNGKKVSIEFLIKIIEEFPEVDLNWLLRENQSNGMLNETSETYKTSTSKEEIISEIEILLKELKTQLASKEN